MNARITKTFLLLSVVALSGCLSTNPEKAGQTISRWIPQGTSQEEAIRIMKRHGFEYGPADGRAVGSTELWFSRETKIRREMCWFYVHFKGGKVDSIEHLGTANDFFAPFEPHVPPSEGG